MATQKNGHTVLVVEDELEGRGYWEMALRYMGYEVESAQDRGKVFNLLRSAKPEISAILMDVVMPECEGMETLRAVRNMAPDLPVIVVSGASSTLNVVTAMKCGATDFLSKPVAHEDLRESLAKALANSVRRAEPAPACPIPRKTKAYISENLRMRELESLVAAVGWSEAPVLIQGETGSGKEVLARELHAHSPRAGQPLLKLNCAALPSELVESELFGYERGAFTGAFQKKAGMFEMADGGTILLDEIGDMDVHLQAKLLQVLQDHEFHRIGGQELIKVNVRLLAATHRDLERAIADRAFREDLYYRLNVINLHLPPLRERKEDIVGLAEHLLRKHTAPGTPPLGLTLELKHALTAYQWPGNVRELENVVRRYLVLRDPARIARELNDKVALKPFMAAGAPEGPLADEGAAPVTPILVQVTRAKQQAEAEAILAALHSTHWNRKQAAALLKIDYKALLYKMKKLSREDNVISLQSPAVEPRVKAAAGPGQ
jgi:two-component system response regulator AtoC